MLAGLTAFLLLRGDGRSTAGGWDRAFAVEDVASIQKIFLADRKGNQTLLERSGEGWLYNSKYPVNPNVMKNLLEAITRVELQFIPPSSAIRPMVEDLAANGIKVEVYGKNDKLLKAYYVGGTTPDERGTYMIMEGSENPYVTQIPNMMGAIRGRYALRGDQWRDKTLFRMDPADIDYLSIEYPKMRNRSFILERNEGRYAVRPFFEVTPPIQRPYKNGIAEAYLERFQGIIAEAFENDNPLRDTIVQRLPFAVITMRAGTDTEQVFRLHPAISSNRFMEEGPPEYEHYLVEVFPDNDFILAQHRLVSQVLWGYDFFFLDEKEE